jgi:hypothetical protein
MKPWVAARNALQLLLAIGLAAFPGASVLSEQTSGEPMKTMVIELRQYKLYPGRRDVLIPLFEREFIESQEALGMRLVGQFRDRNDPTRFTWIREFPNMPERERALNAFYFGPVWARHREAANATLEDNDNVLLLRPATPDLAFPSASASRAAPGAKPGPAGIVVATIYYLWKDPKEGFSDFFVTEMMPEIAAAGLPMIAAYVPERTPNNFPRLPVRQSENLFVWFTRLATTDNRNNERSALADLPPWTAAVAARLADFQERSAQRLVLEPTPRSALR